mmetsp:Transcript_6320/g.10278  ORF Transcript_6320/g.10278 Transcript_6320/m.10278 type:complete len:127 (+) Transcript_6320:4183-4563(+)
MVFYLVGDDHLIFQCLRSLALVVRGLSRQVVSYKITEPSIRQLIFFFGLRITLPNVICSTANLQEVLTEEGVPGHPGVLMYGLLDRLLASSFRKDTDFMKILHNDIRDLGPASDDEPAFFEPKAAG